MRMNLIMEFAIVLSESYRFIVLGIPDCYNQIKYRPVTSKKQEHTETEMMIRTDSRKKEITEILNELNREIIYGTEGTFCVHCYQDLPDGYHVKKNGTDCEIHYASRTDFCRAVLHVLTLQDGAEGEGRAAFSTFGYMCDCSRNAVPKTETLKHLIRLMALLGYHYLGLYTEDTFEVPEEPYFGYMRGRYSGDEIRELVSYAKIFGMEVRPYIQTLAHFNSLMRYEAYSEHMDVNDILLAGDERTYEFLDHLIRSVSETYQTRHINIGMDEAHMVGLGKYLDQHGYTDRFQIMEQHLARVLEICRKYDLRPQMWSDMFFRLAYNGAYYVNDDTNVRKLNIPDDVELSYWDYYSTDETRYQQMLQRHKKLTPHVAFAGGAWKWSGFTPHNAYSMEASKAALGACAREHISDVVITGWGDDGAEASIFSTLPALIFDSDLAYGTDISENAAKIMTGMSFDEYMEMDLANPYPELHDRHNNAGKYLLYNDPLIGTFDSVVNDKTAEYYRDADEHIITLLKGHPESQYRYIFDTQQKLCRVLSQKADLGCRIRAAYQNATGRRSEEGMIALEKIAETELPELIKNTVMLYQTFEQQWRAENKSFGFEVQTIRFGGLRQRLMDVRWMLLEYLAGKVSHIEELETEYLPFHYFNEDNPRDLEYNVWCDMVSPGRMY